MRRISGSTLLTRGMVLGLVLLGMPGCGGGHGGRVAVSGKVAVNGQPLESGTLSLEPVAPTQGPSAGADIKDGSYSIAADRGPLPGKYRVAIKAVRKTGRKIKDDLRKPPDDLVDQIEQYLPARFNTQSELSAELKAGSNPDVNFNLRLDQ